ncbi:hypothetical protein Skr01_70380 [Sphaerisporangium krabiense]|nr:hypothetical protein Skr01_70380 [Sphaerisporangium krabiense]
MYAVGFDTRPDEPQAELDAFNEFYAAHLDDVMFRNPGFVRGARYELARTDPPGAGPRWLAVYGVDGEESARGYAARERPKYPPGPPAWRRATLVWRLLWRRTSWTGRDEVSAGPVALTGIDPADGATGPDFEHFSSRVHLPETSEAFGYDRCVRFELWRELQHPEPGCPAYLTLYEAEVAPEPPARPAPLTPGPPTWEGRHVRWRLDYDLITR